VINDLTESLAAMVRGEAAGGSGLALADIVYDRPVESFSPTQPTLNLFLFDIRENLELRSAEPVTEFVGSQWVTRRPPLRVACSYLVTAWPGNVPGEASFLNEQGLLAQALLVFARFSAVPDRYLKGSLAGQQPPLPMITAQASGLKDPAEFWTAMGNKLRASLSVSVTVSMQPFLDAVNAAPVRTNVVNLGLRDPAADNSLIAATRLETFSIGGIVSSGGAPLAGALLRMTDASTGAQNLSSTSGADGSFRIDGIPLPGDYALSITAGAASKSMNIHIPGPGEKPAASYDIVL
jgi:hypothetical protein